MKDNSAQVVADVERKAVACLQALGLQAVGLVRKQMIEGYDTPHPTYDATHSHIIGEHTAIRDTGALIQDVHYKVEAEQKQVKIGNSIDYGLYVHDGTYKLQGRPYLKDALHENQPVFEGIIRQYLKG